MKTVLHISNFLRIFWQDTIGSTGHPAAREVRGSVMYSVGIATNMIAEKVQ